MSENGSIESEDIIAFQYVFSPPQIFEVPFDLSAEGAVIPASVQPAVDFGGLEDESFAFAQGNNLFHAIGVGLVFIGHGFWARIFPAGREETGEMPQGKVFLKGQRKECPPEVSGIYNSAGCLFRRLGNNRNTKGGYLRRHYEGNFNRNWCCWGVSCSANVDFAFNGRPDLSA